MAKRRKKAKKKTSKKKTTKRRASSAKLKSAITRARSIIKKTKLIEKTARSIVDS